MMIGVFSGADKMLLFLRLAAGLVSLEKDFVRWYHTAGGREGQRQRKLVVRYHPHPLSLFSAARRIPTGSNSTNSLDREREKEVFARIPLRLSLSLSLFPPYSTMVADSAFVSEFLS